MSIKSICGVILVTDDVESLARFYSEGLGLALEREDHGGLDIHYGVDIGTVHFGIHPPKNFEQTHASRGGALAFEVDSIAESTASLERFGGEQVVAAHDEGFGLVTTWRDPAGNLFELVELTHQFDGSA